MALAQQQKALREMEPIDIDDAATALFGKSAINAEVRDVTHEEPSSESAAQPAPQKQAQHATAPTPRATAGAGPTEFWKRANELKSAGALVVDAKALAVSAQQTGDWESAMEALDADCTQAEPPADKLDF